MTASYEEDAGTTETASGSLTASSDWTLNVGWVSMVGDAVAFHIEAYADTARSGAVALTLPSAFWPNQDIRTVGAPFKIAAADGTSEAGIHFRQGQLSVSDRPRDRLGSVPIPCLDRQ